MAKIKISTTQFENLETSEKRKLAAKLYNNFKGKSIPNKEKGIIVEFIGDGARKLAYGGKFYNRKLAILEHLKQIITDMVYSNFGNRKITDKPNVLGYLNFKINVYIDGKSENLRIAIQLRNNGKFYYNHEVNIVT